MSTNLIKETLSGKVEGFCENNVNRWFGIPFAEPPIGNLRFKMAQPISPWNDIKECKSFGKRPIQYMGMSMGAPKEDPEESEDCLTLNIWAPEGATNLPVFFWIYGGAFHYGYGSDPNYDGTYTASQGVVYVTFNYRIGPLGFYDFSSYDKSFDTNCGLSDMLEALKWVKNNIGAFGGNPDNITIAGESAGGTGVYHLLGCPKAQGLFHKAIAQSGIPASSTSKSQEIFVERFLQKLNISISNINELRSLPSTEMKEAAEDTLGTMCDHYPGSLVPSPQAGTDLMPLSPMEALEQGSAKDVDVIFGSCRDEGSSFVGEKGNLFPNSWLQVEKMLKLNNNAEYLPRLKEIYGKLPTEKDQMSAMCGDSFFVANYIKCANAQTKYGNVWTYRYDYVSDIQKMMNVGAAHASDVPFTLGNIRDGFLSMVFSNTDDSIMENLRNQMNGAWVRFVKTGSPVNNEEEWPLYNMENSMFHIFDLQPYNKKINYNDIVEIWTELGVLFSE
jgi:Carboxylesterase type B